MKNNHLDKNIQESWERFLHPAKLRTNMIITSLYITGFEILKDAIVTRIRDFFCFGLDSTGLITSPKYQAEVLSKSKSHLYASLQWLKEAEAINENDIATFESIKKLRNEFAHEITQIINDGPASDWPLRFNDMISLLGKIEKWWIINIEIPTNPDFDGQDINEEEVVPGRVMTLKMMIDIALGSEEESMQYFNQLAKVSQEV